jgi:riboflavin kinase / FMN adenylyltransferase
LQKAAFALKKYDLSGTVVHGNHLGRTLGYPTANLDLDPETPLTFPFGVYVVKAMVRGCEYGGMANFGIRPTIADNHVTIEVHIFDFDNDIYGEKIYVDVVSKLRDEMKFDSLDALVTKMDQDRKEAMKILSGIINPDTDA